MAKSRMRSSPYHWAKSIGPCYAPSTTPSTRPPVVAHASNANLSDLAARQLNGELAAFGDRFARSQYHTQRRQDCVAGPALVADQDRDRENRASLLAFGTNRLLDALPLAEEAYRLARTHGYAYLAEKQIKPILEKIRAMLP